MFRRSSSAHVVSVLALLISLGGASYSATGGSFILGRNNTATLQTRLIASLAGAAFRVDNTGAGANAIGVTIATNPDSPPLAVTSSARVVKLNSDLLNGIDSTGFANRLVVPFNLGPLELSRPITVPPDRPVLVIAATTSSTHLGVAQATLIRKPDEDLTWVGLESAFRIVEVGTSHNPGDNIITLDANAGLFLEVNDANSIRINNLNNDIRRGIVTLIW